MLTGIQAVIYDMDGVLINSEPLWRRAMIQSFNEIGIPFTDEDCRLTTGMRFVEVAQFWFNKFSITTVAVSDFNDLVVKRLQELVTAEGAPMEGVLESLEFFRNKQVKIALGTSSSTALVDTVLEKLGIGRHFESVCSAEHLEYGKPHPGIFLQCASQLQVMPRYCLVIEDSVNGVIAAKAAQMIAVAIPEEENYQDPKYAIADYKFSSLNAFLAKFN